jgi:alpha-beta hydrolase superfamily lysophospholipase
MGEMLRGLAFSLIRISLLLYVGLLAFGYFLSDRYIFLPRPSSYRDGPEFLKLSAEDGNKITALYLLNPSAKFTLLISHGNSEDLGDDRDWHEDLRRAGFNVFAYDYEGYGTSEGRPNETRTYEDESAAYSYLVTVLKTPPNRIIIFGKSVGSGPAVHIAAREPVAGLIVQSGFTSAFRVMTRVSIVPFDKFPNYKDIRNVHCPVLITHGTVDSVISFRHGKELFELANEPKSHLWVTGANHNDVEEVAGDSYVKTLQTFAGSLIDGPAAGAASSSTPSAAIYVANLRGYVTVYPVGSNGDISPITTIYGTAAPLSEMQAIALDAKGNIYVTSNNWTDLLTWWNPFTWTNQGTYLGSSILVFSAGSTGNATPIATIAGPHTGLRTAFSLAVDPSGNIYVGTSIGNDGPVAVEVFPACSNGDTKPEAAIVGHDTALQFPGFENPDGIAVDSMGEILLANGSGLSKGSSILFFPAGSDGDVRPRAAIVGLGGVDGPVGIALGVSGKIYLANGFPPGIRVYSGGSNGNVPPIVTISGSNTGLDGRNLRGIALDSKENMYVTSDGHDSTESSITVFAAGSNGNVKPTAVIAGGNTGLSGAIGIAVGPYSGAR